MKHDFHHVLESHGEKGKGQKTRKISRTAIICAGGATLVLAAVMLVLKLG